MAVLLVGEKPVDVLWNTLPEEVKGRVLAGGGAGRDVPSQRESGSGEERENESEDRGDAGKVWWEVRDGR